MIPEVPELGDDRVRLRLHRDEDIERVLEQCLDPASREWTTVPLDYSRDDAATFVRHVVPGGWVSGQEWGFAVEVDGRFGGTVSLRPMKPHLAEVAYGAHPDIRGTGAMERALRLLLGWGFTEQGLQTVIWYANAGNAASWGLAQRLGFGFEGTLRGFLDHRGTPTDAWTATLLRHEFVT